MVNKRGDTGCRSTADEVSRGRARAWSCAASIAHPRDSVAPIEVCDDGPRLSADQSRSKLSLWCSAGSVFNYVWDRYSGLRGLSFNFPVSSSSSSSRSLGLSVSRPIVSSFASSSCTHALPPPSLSLFPHRFPYLLDRCISSLRVKSCQVYSPFLRQQTRTNIRKKSLDRLFFDRLFISMGEKNDLKVYRWGSNLPPLSFILYLFKGSNKVP